MELAAQTTCFVRLAVLGFPTMIHRILHFYVSGFREMTLGRTLWLLIFAKLAVLLAVGSLFFPRVLTAGQEGEEVSSELIQRAIP